MITKNAEKTIANAISNIKNIVDEIIIIDTGSSDNTLDVVTQFNPKVFTYVWDNNFSNARNFALEKCSCDYVLILDADEEVFADDILSLQSLIKETDADAISVQIYTPLDDDNESDNDNLYYIHSLHRIIKNKKFHFTGNIHEQIIPNTNDAVSYAGSNIRIMHHGYTDKKNNINKHRRNMDILEAVLSNNPKDPFYLFSIGNEYMAMENYEKALDYFEKANRYKIGFPSYSPHLIFRYALCLFYLKKYSDCLQILEEGIIYYPKCNGLIFLMGQTYKKTRQFSLSLKCFQDVIDIGEVPCFLQIISETHTYRTYMQIAEIYDYMGDYLNALEYYMKAIRCNPQRICLIYTIGKIICNNIGDKALIINNLEDLFEDSKNKNNRLLIIDILLNENLYTPAYALFKEINHVSLQSTTDIPFIMGRFLLFEKEIKSAFSAFSLCVQPDNTKGILNNITTRAFEYLAVCTLLDDSLTQDYKNIINLYCNQEYKEIFLLAIENKIEDKIENKIEDSKCMIKSHKKIILSILAKAIIHTDIEKITNAFNLLKYIDGDKALFSLAEIYYNNKNIPLAVKTVLEALKENSELTENALMILNKGLAL